ncbi:uncharacterized protein LOC106948326 [Poecilia latipinna]|uniref:uncharacterized protein LOC106948326 n=1 Tax=Poecilia latipinna TaxID=48699 RepID=UPI00072E3413|nr:PREDICTED: uncharacterized protein LOC106948326 [Poecilia latipinna]
MAELKSLDDLKAERTTVKRLFSRFANNIMRTYMEMSKEDLEENYKKLTLESSKVMEANEDVEAAYMAECKATAAEELSNLQKADIEKTEKECEQKLKEAKLLIRETMWATYGEKELSLALQVAEDECKNVSSIGPDITLEAYEFMLTHLEKLIQKAKEAHQNWNHWAPPAEKKDFNYRVRELEVCLPRMVSQKAVFIEAARKKDTTEEKALVHSLPPIAAIKLKATALPKFGGSKRDYYRWRKEWEALQKQGEPSGSKEVKKFQLLDSLDEKLAKDLRLSTYNSSDEIFRVLDNRFGNKATIALEIIEELQAIPPVRNGQPRRIIELSDP